MIFEKIFCLLMGVKHLFTLHAGTQKIVKQDVSEFEFSTSV